MMKMKKKRVKRARKKVNNMIKLMKLLTKVVIQKHRVSGCY